MRIAFLCICSLAIVCLTAWAFSCGHSLAMRVLAVHSLGMIGCAAVAEYLARVERRRLSWLAVAARHLEDGQ